MMSVETTPQICLATQVDLGPLNTESQRSSKAVNIIYLFLIGMNGLPAWMSVLPVCPWYLWKPEEGVGSPETGIIRWL